MKQILTALASAAILAGGVTVASAQTTMAPTNPNTKVYAYQKSTAPKPAKPAGDAVSMAGQNNPNEQLVGAVPFGSPKWWELMGRGSAGDGGN